MDTTSAAHKKQLLEEIRANRVAWLIVNVHSRRGRKWFRLAQRYLTAAGFKLAGCYAIEDPAELPKRIEQAKQAGARFVIVGGGDGTISSAVDLLAYQNIALGVLPLGTGNGFARTLQISASLEGAIDVLINGNVVDVDLGVVNGDYFGNVISLGFNAHVVHRTANWMKRLFGVGGYLISGLRQLSSDDSFDCRIELVEEGRTVRARTNQVIIANGSFYGVMRISPEASVDNRNLIVCVLRSANKLDVARFWLSLVRRKLPQEQSVQLITTNRARVFATPQQAVDVDGEMTESTPLDVSVAPEALLVMVPRTFVDT